MPISHAKRFPRMSEPTRPILTKKSVSSTSKTFTSVTWPNALVSEKRQARLEVQEDLQLIQHPGMGNENEMTEKRTLMMTTIDIFAPWQLHRLQVASLRGPRRISKDECTRLCENKEGSARSVGGWLPGVAMPSFRSHWVERIWRRWSRETRVGKLKREEGSECLTFGISLL